MLVEVRLYWFLAVIAVSAGSTIVEQLMHTHTLRATGAIEVITNPPCALSTHTHTFVPFLKLLILQHKNGGMKTILIQQMKQLDA